MKPDLVQYFVSRVAARRNERPFFRQKLRLLVGADPLTSNNPALNAARTQ